MSDKRTLQCLTRPTKTDPLRTLNKLKNISPQRRRGAEFYFVNCACGAVNNKKLFSVSLRLGGKNLLTLFLNEH